MTSSTSGPKLHALIVGVSSYRHFFDGSDPSSAGEELGMASLSSAATSAAAIATWIHTDYRRHNPTVPLGSCEILLSPSSDEQIPEDLEFEPATLASFKQALARFVTACATDRDNVAFVYIAGHGVQISKDEVVVLLEDAGAPGELSPIERAIDIQSCRRGMSHDHTAATQFWFVDACRQPHDIANQFVDLEGAQGLPVRPGSVEVSLLYLAASDRELAWSETGRPSWFCRALLESFGGHAAVGPDETCASWYVSTFSLAEQLRTRVRELARSHGVAQNVEVAGGPFGKRIVHRLPIPQVPLRLNLSPGRAARKASADLSRNGRTPVLQRSTTWPLVTTLDAGLYLLEVTSARPFRDVTDILQIMPPGLDRDVEVGDR